ncbi:MAG TPA: glycine cleavage system aminomethyltransferase GcvT, partial [Nitrospirota bacterium]
MKQTVLHQHHLQTTSKMTDFQGWQVPLQFSDVQDEYHAVRASAGLFDISYLGRIEVGGPGAAALLNSVLTRAIAKTATNSAHYCLICNEAGFVLADVLVFPMPDRSPNRRYLLTTNPINMEAVLQWLRQHAGADVQITDVTQSLAQFALQGPRSFDIIESASGQPFKKMKRGAVREISLAESVVLISRTGYTGEKGYELFVPADRALVLWEAVLNAGKGVGLLPCGFASRDILRLESGYLLYGNDLDATRTPFEPGLMSLVDLKKDFIGKETLLKIKASDVKQKLAGFVLLDKGVPKIGGSIFSESREIGVVTSGVHSPHLRAGIGIGYVISRYAQPGQEIEIEVRDKEIAA